MSAYQAWSAKLGKLPLVWIKFPIQGCFHSVKCRDVPKLTIYTWWIWWDCSQVGVASRVGYQNLLLHTKWLDIVFHALWLATQTGESICHSPPGISLDLVREFSFISQKPRNNLLPATTGLACTKTIIRLSVGYLPHLFWARQISTAIHLRFSE